MVIKAVAERLSLEEGLVKEIYDNYWRTVKNCLANPETMNYRVPAIGKFHFPPKKIMMFLITELNKLKKMRLETSKATTQAKAIVEDNFRQLWALKQKFGYRYTREDVRYIKHKGYETYTRKKK